jgi:hypothetical protein
VRRPTPTRRPALAPALARRRVAVALCAAQLVSGACTTLQPVSPGAAPAGAGVRVRFAAPRVVAAATPDGDTLDGDTLVDSAATEVDGVLVEARGDTLVLRGRALTPALSRMARESGQEERRVRIVPQAGDAIEVHRASAARTAGLILGVPLAAFGLLALGYVVTGG